MAEEAPDQELKEIKKRALRRLVIAIILIAAAVAILTFLSRFQPGKTLTTTAPEQPRVLPPETQPVEQAPEAISAPESEVSAVQPAPETTPATEPPPPPQVINEQPGQKALPRKPESRPSGVKPLVKSVPPSPPKEEAKPVAPPPAQPPLPKEAAKGYVVQLGVFSNPENAIELQKKLKEHGIKSYTETKVHIGPFKDKAEAEAALAKLKALGIGAVIVPQH